MWVSDAKLGYYVNVRGKSEYIKWVREVPVRILCERQKPDWIYHINIRDQMWILYKCQRLYCKYDVCLKSQKGIMCMTIHVECNMWV